MTFCVLSCLISANILRFCPPSSRVMDFKNVRVFLWLQIRIPNLTHFHKSLVEVLALFDLPAWPAQDPGTGAHSCPPSSLRISTLIRALPQTTKKQTKDCGDFYFSFQNYTNESDWYVVILNYFLNKCKDLTSYMLNYKVLPQNES